MGSRGVPEIAQFSSPFMRVVDVGSGRVVDQAAQEAFQSSMNVINPKKRSMLAIASAAAAAPTSRPRASKRCPSTENTSQIVLQPRKRVTNPDDFTVSAPISRDRVPSSTSRKPPPMPTYVPPSRPWQPHHTASMLAPSVIVETPSRHAVTVPPSMMMPHPYPSQSMPMPQPMPAPAMSPFMTEANRVVGKVPLLFFFVIGTLVGMLGAMAVVTALNDAGASSKKITTAIPQHHQPVTIHANRLFVYPLMMTTDRAPADSTAASVHGRTASSRLNANAGR